MFGLTVEKLFLVALLAAVIIGPRRLPDYAARAAVLLRRAAVFAVDARRRAEEETGIAVMREDWRALDPRRYDPRRIIREAWADAEADASSDARTTVVESAATGGTDAVGEMAGGMSDVADTVASTHSPGDGAAIAREVVVTTGERMSERGTGVDSARGEGHWIVAGTSAHPRRVWVADERA